MLFLTNIKKVAKFFKTYILNIYIQILIYKISNNKYLFCLIYNIITNFDYLNFEDTFKDFYNLNIDSLKMAFFDDDYYKIYYKYIKNGFLGISKHGDYTLFMFSKTFNDESELIYNLINNPVHNDKWEKINKTYIIFESNKLTQNICNEINEHGNLFKILDEKDLITEYINQIKEHGKKIKKLNYYNNIRYNMCKEIPIY